MQEGTGKTKEGDGREGWGAEGPEESREITMRAERETIRESSGA